MEQELLKIFQEIALVDESVSLETSRSDFENWDSMVHIQLIAELDERLGLSISIDDVHKIEKLSDFLLYAKKG